ncbi:MAG TPA: c-type cytochrome [Polyangiaceae bacterium]|jgi:DNA-binding beta-propeller fold protein YncE/mono/diheme cytochrome c family protein|nr:c-type cytochrome [Polyangiaceae bacterium]
MRGSVRLAPVVLVSVIGVGTACGGTPGIPRASAPIAVSAGICASSRAGASTVVPVASTRAGSTVALATRGEQTIAYVADEDGAALHVIDVGESKELGTTLLDGRPSQLLFLSDGRLVVLLRDKARGQVFEIAGAPEKLEARCGFDTAPEPVGLAVSPDDALLVVTSGWGRALTAFDTRTLARAFEVPLAREPRAVVVSGDGKTAYVSHAVGAKASRVDLTSRIVTEVSLRASDTRRDEALSSLRDRIEASRNAKEPINQDAVDAVKALEAANPSCQGFALAMSSDPGGRVLAPQVLVDTGNTAGRAPGYGDDSSPTEVPDVAVIDAKSGQPIAASLERPSESPGWGGDPRDPPRPECLLPRAAVMNPARGSLLVSCYGIDVLIEYDGRAASPARAERTRWPVGAGPSGIAVEPTKNRAVVWSQFDHELDVVDLGAGELVDDRGHPPVAGTRIAVTSAASRGLSSEAALGRVLFHAVGDTRIARDGRACASCHPDGRDDALVWSTPDGPRRSIMLAGRVRSTAPYSWSGGEADLRVHLASTFDRLNGAGGLKSVELDALTAYVESMPPPPARPDDGRGALVARGAQLFASADVGCAGCHGGAASTDNGVHDVASKGAADRLATFNTPTLRFVGGTGPYFHDGRYPTLHDLLTSNADAMGHTKQLAPADLDALEAYLRTL